MNKPDYITENDWKLLKKKYKNLSPIIELLDLNYPIQYLIGDVDFYGYKILVNKHVLIPRFETEGLVEKTIELLKQYKLTDTSILEIGTGSGCIPIVLKSKLNKLRITSIDISSSALRLAKKNAKINKCDITFIKSDLKKYKPLNTYSVIISNPPYISEDEEIDPKCKFEPYNALYADNNGLDYYYYIIDNYQTYLTDKFIMAFEIGYQQGSILKSYAKKKFRNAKIIVEKDLAGKDRYLFIINE